MQADTVFILLFIVASAVAIGVRWLRVPYTVALVFAGLLLGSLHLFEPPHLTKELLFTVFLPGLLFEAAFHIEFSQFWRNRLAITSLAVPGVVAAIALTALILAPVANRLHFVQGFTWQHAMVFGALIAATDPIAVIAIFRSLGVPQRLAVLMDGESLLNDGTGIVFFMLSLAAVAGNRVTASGLAVEFGMVVGGGVALGTLIGLAVSQVIKNVDDPMIEITLTTIAAYGAFVAAEHFHVSGVIATVAAGMLCGNYAARTGMSPSTRVAVETFWEYVSFALNSIVFLLIGLDVHVRALLASWLAILTAYLVVVFGRTLVIFGVSSWLRTTRERIPWRWSAVLTWGGLRGGLSMVLALSLPDTFPHRQLLVTMTFGVVILSILVHGLTMAPLLRRLGIVRGRAARAAYDVVRGKLQAASAAVREIERMSYGRFADPDVLAALKAEYQKTIAGAEHELRDMDLDPEEFQAEEIRWVRRHLLLAERKQVSEAFREGLMGQTVYDQLLADIDARLLQVESGETEARSQVEAPRGQAPAGERP